MPSTNFQQWNPGQANQESDAAYTADSQRSGGAAASSIFQSALANKLFYQVTTWVVAMATMLQGKGFSTSDADVAALAAVLANLLTTADIRTAYVAVSYSAAPAYDLSKGDAFGITLAGNIAPTFTNAIAGQLVTLFFTQDGVGSRTVSWPSNVQGGLQPVTSPGIQSRQTFMCFADNSLRAITGMQSDIGLDGTPIGQSKPAAANFTTPTAGDNSQKAATTAFLRLGAAWAFNANNGYLQLPAFLGGLIIQWGYLSGVGASQAVTFPIPFPTKCVSLAIEVIGSTARVLTATASPSTTGFNASSNGSAENGYYIALGH